MKAAKEACVRYPSTVKGFRHKNREQLKKMPMPNLMAKTMELAKWSYTHGKMSRWNTLNPENGELSSALVSLMSNASRTSLMKDYLAFQKDYEGSQKKDNADELPENTRLDNPQNIGIIKDNSIHLDMGVKGMKWRHHKAKKSGAPKLSYRESKKFYSEVNTYYHKRFSGKVGKNAVCLLATIFTALSTTDLTATP